MTTKAAQKTRVKPFQDQVLVCPIREDDVTAGGIVLPASRNKVKPSQGRVVAVGPGRVVDGERVPIDLEVGQLVVFQKYAGTEIEIDGVDHKLVRADTDVLAALEFVDDGEE